MIYRLFILIFASSIWSCSSRHARQITDFSAGWKFLQGDDTAAYNYDYDDSDWRVLNLPHDWSIEGAFSEHNPAGSQGGGLPTGTGWYRRSFTLPHSSENKHIYIDFDGVYRNSEVWINGHYLGKRPNGYVSFRYDLTPFLVFGKERNVLAVRVDNSDQPNSRWYTGSGIYRNVRLVITGKVHIDHWGTFISFPQVSEEVAAINLDIRLRKHFKDPAIISVKSVIKDMNDKKIVRQQMHEIPVSEPVTSLNQHFLIENPVLWSVDNPYLYKVTTCIYHGKKLTDTYNTYFGIRYFNFDDKKGFFLNGKHLKILGVCNHHDLGALGAAVNTRAIERQLELLKEMGCNAVRTAHNPPAPELLDLCDKMGFLVVDEAFDTWKKQKVNMDYHLEWEAWHKKDLCDFIKRDRNHPSVIMWSIGNEIREQFDSSGITMAKELAGIVKSLDTTRPVTCALTENIPEKNFIYRSGALDVLSFNYKQNDYRFFPDWYPGEAVIAAETGSALASRGVYNMPSDSIQKWPEAYNIPLKNPNPDLTVSAYDHIHAYWGSTHEETWKIVEKLDFMAGLFVWSGFDYLGEPVPYDWPARSSYYGIIDLAGFPKDAYYMYQSEWTDKPVLHVFPHWNWQPGQIIDVWAYYNNADEVELFINGRSLGAKSKKEDECHVMWRVKYAAGTVKAVSRKDGKTILVKEIHTAGKPAKIKMTADRQEIRADGRDLAFISVRIVDDKGIMVPDAGNPVNFEITGMGDIAGTDNGYQASLEPFRTSYRKAFNGMCLVIIQSKTLKGNITLTAKSDGLQSETISVRSK